MFEGIIHQAKEQAEYEFSNEKRELRDRFAIAALTGICANPKTHATDSEVAEGAYRVADAMLEAREK